MRSTFTSKLHLPALLCTCLGICAGTASAQPDHKISSLTLSGGKAQLGIDGPSGEFKTQSSSTLGNDWVQLGRSITDGSTQQFDDPQNGATSKFYRLESVPQADETHLTGPFATALIATVAYGDLQTTFGFSFAQGEATIPAGNDLSFATRNQRVYSAIIAALSKMAQDVSDSFASGSEPTPAEIATAFAADLSDGNLDGNNSGVPVQIGSTGSALPAYTPQNFIDALNVIKGQIPGLYNVEFIAAAPAAPAAPASAGVSVEGGEPPVANAPGGSFTPSTPAKWGDFYWGSSEWQ